MIRSGMRAWDSRVDGEREGSEAGPEAGSEARSEDLLDVCLLTVDRLEFGRYGSRCESASGE